MVMSRERTLLDFYFEEIASDPVEDSLRKQDRRQSNQSEVMTLVPATQAASSRLEC